jgi:hypothetical protein
MNNKANRPNRCQATHRYGQCNHDAVEGEIYCPYHCHDPQAPDKKALHAYLLTNPSLAATANRHSQVEELKSLREEIVLCRSLVEHRLNMIESNADYLAAIGQVNMLFITLEKLISSCHKLEISLGNLLSREELFTFASELSSILVAELKDIPDYEKLVDRITQKIVKTIGE